MAWVETSDYIRVVWNELDELETPIKVAAFDLDDTLIHRPIGKFKNRVVLMDNSVKPACQKLMQSGFIFVVFTNQGGMTVNKNFDLRDWIVRMEKLKKMVTKKIPHYYFAIYAAKTYDAYRKPNLGLWNRMKKDLLQQFELDRIVFSSRSFYCGDAAGRIRGGSFRPNAKKDFSDSDRKFALNIGIDFVTPEEFFLKEKPIEFAKINFDPAKFIKKITNGTNDSGIKYKFESRPKEMIIMTGIPGSGKSEFVRKYIMPADYKLVNQDLCRTRTKCLQLAETYLSKGVNLVIDNTNPDRASRKDYIELANKYGYKIRSMTMVTDIPLAKHLNNVRNLDSSNQIPRVKSIVYSIFKKKYEKPNEDEGFDLIESVPFALMLDKLKDKSWKKFFMQYSED